MTSTQNGRWLKAILVSYVVLATIYSVVTPLFEASDELWHYPMVKYMADNGLQLPPQDPSIPAPWRQEGSQPPLYYMIAAILTSGVDTSDMEFVRRINPHSDIGVVRPDGNANMIVHRVESEAFPWQKTALAVHIVRFFSIALGLGTVTVTYLLAKEIFPEHPIIALGATALNAFMPMFLFISGSVNNDNLSNFLGNTLTLLVVKLLKTHTQPHWHLYVLLGVCSGAGLLAKLNLGFFMPVIALGLLILTVRLRNWQPIIVGGLISGGLTILIAGWWYWHNWQLYNDPTGLSMFLQMVGRRPIFANAAQLWSERHSFTQAYWGFFGGVNVPLPDAIYLVFNIIGGMGLLGVFVFVAYSIGKQQWSLDRWIPASITLLWPIVTFASYLRWTAETPASQGRLIFVALSAISIWMMAGMIWWLPRRGQIYIAGIIGVVFGATALVSPFAVIAPVYAQPPQADLSSTNQAVFSEANDTRGRIALIASHLETTSAKPEEYVYLNTTWQIEQQFTADWSLFAHLVTSDGLIVWQRDVYPGQGTLATSDLPIERAWQNRIAVPIPNTAYAPLELNVVVGWYNLNTGERLILSDGNETFKLGSVTLNPRSNEAQPGIPNPIHINFDNQIELIGYSLSDLTPKAGDTIELILYWRGLRDLDTDYKVFANIIDPKTLTKYAASDGMPVNWQAPTTTWEVNTIIKDSHKMTVDINAPPGIYETQIGLYSQKDEGLIHRLRIVTADGGMANDYMSMTRVRILPAGNP